MKILTLTSLTPTRGPVGGYPQIFLKFSGLKKESLRSILSKGNSGKNKNFLENVSGTLEQNMALTKVLG
jgi:hypothetical protein